MKIARAIWFASACLGLGLLLGAGPTVQPDPTSADAVAALQRCQNAATKANTEYIQTISAARAKYIDELQIQLDKQTKVGNLDEALRLRETIQNLKAAATRPADDRPDASYCVGTWWVTSTAGFKGIVHLAADGTGSYEATKSPFRWTVEDGKLLFGESVYTTRQGNTLTGQNTVNKSRMTAVKVEPTTSDAPATAPISSAWIDRAATTQPTFKSADADAAARKYEIAEGKARADYATAAATAKSSLIRDLEAAQEKVTRAGDLDEALRIRTRVTALKVPPEPATAPKPASFLTPAEVVGTWTEGSGTKFVLDAKGKFTYARTQQGTWRLTPKALILTWSGGSRTDTYDTRDGDKISGDSTIGHKVTIRRVPPGPP